MRRFQTALLAVLPTLTLPGSVCGDDEPVAVVEPSPLQDDATLRHVTFVGSRFGWAVGDRGVLWRTEDGGATWSLVPTPVDVPLRSACFLTNHVGWVAGGAALAHSSASQGVLLFTRDGGRNWERLGEHALPRLFAVRFFGLKEGVVVGSATADNPSGVFTTRDGGVSWQAVASNRAESWRSAAFGSSAAGVLVGKEGRVALLAGGRLLESRVAPLGLRTIHGATMSRDETGWVVGDRGLVLHTEAGGVSWGPPAGLPRGIEDVCDFRAVAARGDRVWVAGSPGSVVLHSPDGGRTWRRQRTGVTVPIHALHFGDDDNGVAVGAFGTILHTSDGGTTWRVARGGKRRAAILAIHAHAQRASFRLLARESVERGYRSATHVVVRRDVGPNAATKRDLDLRLDEAVTWLGGAAGDVDSRLPLDLPGLDTNGERLREAWNERTDGRLDDVLADRLSLLLKTWRPTLVVLDDPPPNDEATRLVNEAVLRAIERAADPTLGLRHAELAGLEPWKVRRILARLPEGSRGAIGIEPYQALPRSRTTVLSAASRAESLLFDRTADSAATESYRIVGDSSGATPAGNTFFAGLVLVPGSEARRELLPLDEPLAEVQRRLVERQRNVHAYAVQGFDDPRRAAGMLAELRGITRGMPDDQAATLLLSLAREHRRRNHWDRAEETYVELVERFPEHPASREAARWLFQLWTSTETAWQRARHEGAGAQRHVNNADAIVQRLQRSIQLASHVRTGEGDPPPEVRADPWYVTSRPGTLNDSPKSELVNGHTWGADWRSETVLGWQRRAAWMASLLREKDPETFRSPEIQFPLATLYRQREAYGRADAIHRHFQRTATGTAWQRLAETEVWMLNPVALPPREFAVCKRTAEPPRLDGQLGDACWSKGTGIELSTDGSSVDDHTTRNPNAAYALFAYDSKHLYVAASLPRDPRLPDDGPQRAGRSHDADLDPFDRLTFLLDVDRDYTTWYDLRVDQRGCTRDACWEDTSWDPKWYVATKHVDGRWILEAAIPFSELVPRPPLRGHVWGLGLVRTKPGLAVESWTKPVSAEPRPETFGLLRFE